MTPGDDQVIRDIYSEISRLRARVERLENNTAPTIPIYNSDRWPIDAVEGQIVIAAPGGVGGVISGASASGGSTGTPTSTGGTGGAGGGGGGTGTPAGIPGATAYWSETFDSGGYTNKLYPVTSGGTTLVDVITDPTDATNKLLRLYTPAGASGPNASSSMAALSVTSYGYAHNPGGYVEGEDIWYRADIYLPAGYVPSVGNWNWFTEWHVPDNVVQNNPAYPGGGGVSCGLGVVTDYHAAPNNPRFWFRVAGGNYQNRTEDSTEQHGASLALTPNTHYVMYYHFIWSRTNGAALTEWYVNGSLQWSTTIPNLFSTTTGTAAEDGFAVYNYHVVPTESVIGGGDRDITTCFDNLAVGPTMASLHS